MAEDLTARASRDDVIIAIAAERLTTATHRPADEVEATVRDELTKWRSTARIQTFVPIFAERSARDRLAG
jgi:hypothetical protein